MSKHIEKNLNNLIKNEFDKHNVNVFSKLYDQFLNEPSTINWNDIKLLSDKHQIDYKNVKEKFMECTFTDISNILKRLSVVKLNGGLGTTMHCKGPKSLIELRDGLTFLDFVLLQNEKLNEKYNSQVPLILMNSFNTDDETKKALKIKSDKLTKNLYTFVQSKCPRIFADTLLPVPDSFDSRPNDGWYPPGHGNVFQSMAFDGILDKLIAEGRDICFFSNIDNTGANVDLAIAKAMCDEIADYIMEVTPKTLTDIKGGTVIEINNNLMHLEMPQVPKDKIDDFCSLRVFKIFNTNNIWVNLREVKLKLSQLKMEILANYKKLGIDDNFRQVIQLETSIGGAIRNFKKALCLKVERHRFLPVKSTQELLPLMSNAYFVDKKSYIIKLVSENWLERPLAILSPPEFYAPLNEYYARFSNIPDMSELKLLKIQGDVWFGKNVKLIGNVEIKVENGEKKIIENRTIVMN